MSITVVTDRPSYSFHRGSRGRWCGWCIPRARKNEGRAEFMG